jgi:hypothetical protein
MAIIGDLNTPFGVNANYHIITSYGWRKFYTISVEISSYLDQTARNDNCPPLVSQSFTLANVPPNYAISVKDLYNEILALPIQDCVFANAAIFSSDNLT